MTQGIARTETYRRLWFVAGGLLIGYIVLTFVGVTFQSSLMLGDSPSKASAALITSSMAKSFGGGYVEFLAQLAFLAGALLLARLVRGEGPAADWLSSLMAGAIVAAVAVTIATGFAAGAAAVYDGHHGASLSTVTTVNDVRNFGFFLTGGLIGVFALAAGASVLISGALARWVAYSSVAIGMLSIAAVPASRTGITNLTTMLGFVWIVAVGVASLRRGRRSVITGHTTQAAMSV